MRIQHNIMAMNAYRNYNTNTSALSKNLEKLSSGYKINRAGDDAAGLAISEKMRAQITGLDKAQDNAKDGISLVQTAEGALTEVHDMLNRMYSLAEQSANGTYENETDRVQLQKEVAQLKSEINRIADSANFNGINLLDGTMSGTEAQMTTVNGTVGATFAAAEEARKGSFTIDFGDLTIYNSSDAQQTINIDIGDTSFTVTLNAGETLTAEDVASEIQGKINNSTFVAGGATFSATAEGGKLSFTMNVEPPMGGTPASYGVEFTVDVNSGATNDVEVNNGEGISSSNITSAVIPTLGSQAQATFDIGTITDGKTVKIGNTTYTFAVGADSKYKSAGNVVDLTGLDAKYFNADGTLTADGTAEAMRALTRVAKDNGEAVVSYSGTDTTLNLTSKKDLDQSKYTGMDLTKNDATAWGDFVQTGNAADGGSGGLVLQIGDTSESFNQLRVSISDCHTSSLGIDSLSIADQDSAAAALNQIKSAINYVSDVRGTLGATQNRLDHTINNLSVMQENIQDAESTIRDTDIADEMMSYTKNNILIQSAQAMLAQANQVPQGVLQLLQ